MSTTVISESVMMNTGDSQTVKLTAAVELEFAKCECCGLTEECTVEYIETIRERYNGKWICGLCSEAVKEEMMRCDDENQRLINAEEALTRHLNFCKKFRSGVRPPPDPTVHLIAAVRQLLRRRSMVDGSPKVSLRSVPCSPTRSGGEMKANVLVRAESCIPTITLVDSDEYRAQEESDDE